MVAHAVEDRFGRHFFAGHDPQGHAVRGVVAHRIIRVSVHIVGHRAEEGPDAGFAGAQGAEVERRICVAEAEIRIGAVVIPHFAGERNDVGRVKAVFGVVLLEGRDARLIGVRRNISVGNAACDPYDALVGVAALAVGLVSLADQLHDPRFVAVDDRERFAARRIAVGVGQLGDRGDGLAGRLRTLERDVNQRTVVDQSGRVGQFRPAAVCRLADDERMFVHVAHRRVGLAQLGNVGQIASRVPFVDGHHGAGLVASAGCVVQRAVQRVRVGGIGDHGRTVGRGSLGDDEIGAGRCRAVGEYGRCSKAIAEFFHRFLRF